MYLESPSVREEVRAAGSTISTTKGNREKKKIPFSVRNEKTLERRRTKDISKMVPVRQESQMNRSAFIFEGAKPKGMQLCVEWRPYDYVLNTVDLEETWMDPGKDAIQRSISSQCGTTLPHSREKRTIARTCPARTQK